MDSGIIDMNDLVEIWKSKEIPEGPIVLRRALPDDVKQKVVTFLSELHGKDPQCAYNMAAGETSGFTPITHEALRVDHRRPSGTEQLSTCKATAGSHPAPRFHFGKDPRR